jgi:hypothetical protein
VNDKERLVDARKIVTQDFKVTELTGESLAAFLLRMIDEREAFIEAFKQFAPKCGQLLDGWHCDVAWSEYDTEVRNELTALHLRAYQEFKP